MTSRNRAATAASARPSVALFRATVTWPRFASRAEPGEGAEIGLADAGVDEPHPRVVPHRARDAVERGVRHVQRRPLGQPHVEVELPLRDGREQVARQQQPERQRDHEAARREREHAARVLERAARDHRVAALDPTVAGVEGPQQPLHGRLQPAPGQPHAAHQQPGQEEQPERGPAHHAPASGRRGRLRAAAGAGAAVAAPRPLSADSVGTSVSATTSEASIENVTVSAWSRMS